MSKKFTPIIETALRAFEKLPGKNIVEALNITAGNATTKKLALRNRLLEIWKVFDGNGLQLWAIPDDDTPRKMAMLATSPNLVLGAPTMEYLQTMVFHFPTDTPQEKITQLLHQLGAQMITLEHLPNQVVATLTFNQFV